MKTTIGALIVALVAAYYAYYLNRSAPDVRYTLSDRIPVSFLGPDQKAPENVQQLEVKNLGNAEAKRIQIKIKGEITSFKVEKFSASDAPQTFNQNRTFEVVYPELPPQAAFRLIFKSIGDGITYGDVNISHAGGQAQQALSKKEQGAWDYFLYLASAANIFGALFNFSQGAIANRAWRNQYKRVDQLLNDKKPWFISRPKWQPQRKEALEYRIGRHYFLAHDIKASEAYIFLSADRPVDIAESDWSSLASDAVDCITERYSSIIYDRPARQLLELLAAAKPKYFPQNKWKELEEKAIKQYFSLRLERTYTTRDVLTELREPKPDIIDARYWPEYLDRLQKKYIDLRQERFHFVSLETILRNLREVRPDEIREECWSEYIDKVRKEYTHELSLKLEMQKNPMQFLGEQDLNPLKADERELLEERAYRLQIQALPDPRSIDEANKFLNSDKPQWIRALDYELLRANANRVLHFDTRAHELEATQKHVTAKSQANETLASELANERRDTSALKDKIERQLNIIQALLSDPSSINRIEDYSNAFAPGNFANLKKIATILSNAAEERI